VEFNFEDELLKLYREGFILTLANHISFIACKKYEGVDLRNDIYIKAMENKELYKHRSENEFQTWLYKVGLRLAYNKFRRVADKNPSDFRLTFVTKKASFESGDNGYYSILLEQALSLLNPMQLTVIIRMLEGYTNKEIGLQLGRSGSTVDGQRWSGQKKIKEMIGDDWR